MSKLLLAIDFINDIVHEDGAFGKYNAPYLTEHNVLENANKAIKHARENNIPVAHVKVGFSKSYLECPAQSPVFSNARKFKALELGTWGTEFHDYMDVQEDDYIITKHRISAFYNTDLECVLRANGIDEIIIIGVSTQMTVELTAREAHDRDYIVTVLEDACGANDFETHTGSVNSIKKIATVSSVNDWIS
ncbi:cysteine hydrolase [Thiotrichales bacterium 19S11-10]|nr:cysteine hydrolase [Thiotrichales bacterium 19S11-10]